MNVDDTCINNSKDKAESLNKQFQSVFTLENLSHMPNCNGLSTTMPNITISVEGYLSLWMWLKHLALMGYLPAMCSRNCPNSYSNTCTIIKQWSNS